MMTSCLLWSDLSIFIHSTTCGFAPQSIHANSKTIDYFVQQFLRKELDTTFERPDSPVVHRQARLEKVSAEKAYREHSFSQSHTKWELPCRPLQQRSRQEDQQLSEKEGLYPILQHRSTQDVSSPFLQRKHQIGA